MIAIPSVPHGVRQRKHAGKGSSLPKTAIGMIHGISSAVSLAALTLDFFLSVARVGQEDAASQGLPFSPMRMWIILVWSGSGVMGIAFSFFMTHSNLNFSSTKKQSSPKVRQNYNIARGNMAMVYPYLALRVLCHYYWRQDIGIMWVVDLCMLVYVGWNMQYFYTSFLRIAHVYSAMLYVLDLVINGEQAAALSPNAAFLIISECIAFLITINLGFFAYTSVAHKYPFAQRLIRLVGPISGTVTAVFVLEYYRWVLVDSRYLTMSPLLLYPVCIRERNVWFNVVQSWTNRSLLALTPNIFRICWCVYCGIERMWPVCLLVLLVDINDTAMFKNWMWPAVPSEKNQPETVDESTKDTLTRGKPEIRHTISR